MTQATPFTTRFRDRFAAGRELVRKLERYRSRDDAVLLALPCGGVEVAYAIAEDLDIPLDIFVVRKLGVPGHRELAMGAMLPLGMRDGGCSDSLV